MVWTTIPFGILVDDAVKAIKTNYFAKGFACKFYLHDGICNRLHQSNNLSIYVVFCVQNTSAVMNRLLVCK
ncbi:hypothetical protein BIV60_19065 [Bacillus sp. MUM 116]|nr:hypothetical protein BIV60_19065 [Bacillus sp. MUM 116]